MALLSIWSLIIGFFLTRFAIAQTCDDLGCEGIGIKLDGQCGVDPHDGSLFGVVGVVCPCYRGSDFIVQATYTGNDGTRTIEESSTRLTTTNSADTVTFSLTGTNTNIQSGAEVNVLFIYAIGGTPVGGYATYTYSPVTSIYYTDTTTSVTTTTSSVITTTSTATVTSTTAIPQQTSTKPCTTGTATITASTLTITSTSTVNPTVKTKKSTRTVTTTKRASCISNTKPSKQYRRDLRAEAREQMLAARQAPVNEGVVETHWCSAYAGAPLPTTYTTSTIVNTETVTTTDTSTAFETQTETTTQTPTPLTTTVCSNVKASTTITPRPATSTVIKTGKQSTKTVIETRTYTVTAYPQYPTPCPTSNMYPGPKPTPKKSCKILKPTKRL